MDRRLACLKSRSCVMRVRTVLGQGKLAGVVKIQTQVVVDMQDGGLGVSGRFKGISKKKFELTNQLTAMRWAGAATQRESSRQRPRQARLPSRTGLGPSGIRPSPALEWMALVLRVLPCDQARTPNLR